MLSTFSHDICQHYPLPLVEFSAVNLCSCNIKIITPISPKLLFISQLYLDNNLIQSLSGIQQFMNLQILSLNFNFISQIEQLSKIHNKFLMRELSLIGNPIQSCVNNEVGRKWLHQEGFYNLVVVNDVGAVGKIRARRCFIFNITNHHKLSTDNSNYSFQQSPHKTNHKSSSAHRHQHQITYQSIKRNHPNAHLHHQQLQSMNIQGMSQASNQRSSKAVYLTKREGTLNSTKRGKEFQSTGDTRKKRLTPFRVESSPGESQMLYTSPNFNYPLNQFHHSDHQQHHRKSLLSNRKVTEFNLYPVDQQMNRSRKVEDINYYYGIENRKRWDGNEDDYAHDDNSSSSFSKIKSLNRTIQYHKKVNPFKQSSQYIKSRSKSFATTQHLRYSPYRSEKYQLSDINAQHLRWRDDECQQQQENIYSHNQSTSVFHQIQREIPIYKEAIAIAFYYRNLLEKVFRGLGVLTNKSVRIKTQKSSQLSNRRQISDYFDKERFVTEQEQIKHEYQQQPQKQQQEQSQLLRYAWMKLQLYSQYKKIMGKYEQSSAKKGK